MTFDVIIPTYNNLEELQRCLSAWSRQHFRDFRCIVCVDGSTDGTQAWLGQQQFSFPLLSLEHADKANHGRNATRNLSLAHLSAEYICFCDSDMIPEPDLLLQHLALLSTRDCVSVGNVLYQNAETNLWSAYAQSRGKNKYSHNEMIPYAYLATGNCAHATKYFVELGGQDASMRHYGGGDTEYALRLHKHAQLPVLFNERALVVGDMNKTVDEALRQMRSFGEINLHYIARRHPEEKSIFFLNRMTEPGLQNTLFRLMLQDWLSVLLSRVCGVLPKSIAIRLLNYCVITNIYSGWKKGR